jgi:hypothetical protein
MKILGITLSGAVLALTVGCSSSPGPNTTRDAGIGAATGAVLGGVIGHQSGETANGAAVGAAVGGIAGGAYGANRDREEDRRAVGGTAADLPATGQSTPYGFSSSDYMKLMTQDEINILQARARSSGRTNYELTDFLTEEEKANLRRRANSNGTAPVGR